jgi:hypothetical protein
MNGQLRLVVLRTGHLGRTRVRRAQTHNLSSASSMDETSWNCLRGVMPAGTTERLARQTSRRTQGIQPGEAQA